MAVTIELQPGDRAIIRNLHCRSVVTVGRTTATQIVVPSCAPGRPFRFWKKNGREVGATGWDCPSIEPATPEALDEIERNNLAAEMTRVPEATWRRLGLERLRELKAALESAAKEPTP